MISSELESIFVSAVGLASFEMTLSRLKTRLRARLHCDLVRIGFFRLKARSFRKRYFRMIGFGFTVSVSALWPEI